MPSIVMEATPQCFNINTPAQTSQLCKPLSAILQSDSGALSMLDYFVQYMEEEDALHLLQFWFAVESFKKATPSPKHSTDHCKGLNTSAANKQCDAVSVETSVNSHMTQHQRPNLECITDVMIPHPTFSNNTEFNYSTDTSVQLDEGTRHCNVEGRKNTCIANSDTLKGQRKQLAVSDVAPTDGIHVHQRLLKQLSLNVSVDALSIYTTYIALNALCPVSMPDEIRQQIEVNICPEDGKVNRNCFDRAQTYVYRLLEERYHPGFLSSHQLCKYQFEYISSGKLCLLDFLLGDNALFYFMEFMEQENSTAVVQFWLTANSFRSQLSDPLHVPNLERDTGDAMAIYERYFSLQAFSPLHFGDTIRMDIENNICDEHGPRVDSYDTAQRQAYDRMNELYFPGFLKSSVYLRFLNELVITLNRPVTSATTPATSNLAEATSSLDKSNLGDQIDFAQNLDDPDSLWRRPSTVFRLGYVDEFGQYISEIEPIPAKSLKQKGDVSKKFSWLGKSRDEEELAMKIARTIVREILDTYRTEKNLHS